MSRPTSKPAWLALSAALAAAPILPGCASVPQDTLNRAARAEIRIYEVDELPAGRYKSIRLLWAGSSSIPFWGREYKSADEGITALQREARRIGANGLTSVGCFQNGTGLRVMDWSIVDPVYTCYAEAIRVSNGER